MTPRPDVSCVLVAWNAGHAVGRCIGSVRRAAAHAGVQVQVIVVDNASNDDCCAGLELKEGDRLIANPVNVGFGAAVALALPHVAADWAMLTNTDLAVSQDFFVALRPSLANAARDVATLVPEMRFSGAMETINTRGVALDRLGVPREVDAGVPVTRPPSAMPPLGASSGCCCLRMEALAAVRGVEPGYFAYLEDVDLAVRLARAGFRAELVPAAVAYHEGSGGVGAVSPTKTWLVARNRRLLFALEGPRAARTRVGRAAVEIGHAAVSALLSRSAAPISGRADALRLRRYTRFVRRSRALHDERSSVLPLVAPASPLATLRTKRGVVAAAQQADRPASEV
jgi:hypothetical protein